MHQLEVSKKIGPTAFKACFLTTILWFACELSSIHYNQLHLCACPTIYTVQADLAGGKLGRDIAS